MVHHMTAHVLLGRTHADRPRHKLLMMHATSRVYKAIGWPSIPHQAKHFPVIHLI